MAAFDDASTIVVVGASLAGLRAVEELRAVGYGGRLVFVGAEPHRPYDRPPLSKQFLAGEVDADETALRRGSYDELDLDWRLGRAATSLDVESRTVRLADGEVLEFDGAVLATGSVPRTLPGTPPLGGIHLLRTLDDSAALRADLDHDPAVVVVGAGFIGAEVAATCRRRGLTVTLLEALPSPMVRGLGPVLGDALAALHRAHGVDLHLGVGVAGFEGRDRVEAVRLDDGRVVDADVVVVGVGVRPATDWLEGSGLTLENGIVCDETCLAAPRIVAAGDVARWPNPRFGGEPMRLEHWTNAAEQGVYAGRRLLLDDAAEPFDPVPFVWSDQYDVKIQVAGVVRGDDRIELVEGSVAEHRFVAAVGRAGRLVGAVAFNRPRPLMQLRRLVADGTGFDDSARAEPRDRVAAVALVSVTGPDPAGVAVLRLLRTSKRNALSIALRDEMSDALESLGVDDALRVLVITGGDEVFSAGFDLEEFTIPDLADELWASSDRWHRDLLTFPLPTVAAVSGAALGGGFDLAVMCDLRIASDTARFAHPEHRFSQVVYGPLHDLVGGALARDVALTGRTLDAAEALRVGLVSRVVPASALLDEADTATREIALAPRDVLAQMKVKILRRAGVEPGATLDL